MGCHYASMLHQTAPKKAATKTQGELGTLAILGVFLIVFPLCRDIAVAVVVEVALDACTAVSAMRSPSPPPNALLRWEGGREENSNGSSSMELWDLERRRGAGGAAKTVAFPLLLLVLSPGWCLDKPLVLAPAVAGVDALLPFSPASRGPSIPSRACSVVDACLQRKQQHQVGTLGLRVHYGYRGRRRFTLARHITPETDGEGAVYTRCRMQFNSSCISRTQRSSRPHSQMSF